jgi:catechol 2,3-dioxygenase-like lactoylglutathione lyase family enzyme
VTISHFFAGIAVSDFAAARTWYEALLGRPPDMLPEEGEAVWRVSAFASIYITADPDRAGSSFATLAVTDIEEHAAALTERGLSPSDPGDYSGPHRLIVTDDDGNTITFFQDPGQSIS